jgi:hypothetical protein
MNQHDSSTQVWHFHRDRALAAHCTVTKPATSPRWALCFDVQGEVTVEWFPTRDAALDTASAIVNVLLTHGWSPRTPEEALPRAQAATTPSPTAAFIESVEHGLCGSMAAKSA